MPVTIIIISDEHMVGKELTERKVLEINLAYTGLIYFFYADLVTHGLGFNDQIYN